MRKIEVEIHKTFITANTRISDPKAWEPRGFDSVKLHDEAIIKLLCEMPEGSLLAVLGNLFSNSAKTTVVEHLTSTLDRKKIQLMCVEGNHDHKYLWHLKKNTRIELLGDMALLESSTAKAVVSFYPMAEWSQKRHGHQHLFGFESDETSGSFASPNGGYQCSMNTLVHKFKKPVVSMQFLFDQIKKEQKPESFPH